MLIGPRFLFLSVQLYSVCIWFYKPVAFTPKSSRKTFVSDTLPASCAVSCSQLTAVLLLPHDRVLDPMPDASSSV